MNKQPHSKLSISWLALMFVFAWGGRTIILGAEWNQFRGPNGSGVANNSNPPIHLNPEDATWQTPLPSGHSSPILAKKLIVVSGHTGNELETIALRSEDGVIQWKIKAPSSTIEKVHEANNLASSTPCTDGSHIFVYFGSYGLLCYDLEGELVWKHPLPVPKTLYGTSTSPILYGDNVILVLDDDRNLPDSQLSRSRVIAVNKKSGLISWQTPRPYNRSGWSTPMIWKTGASDDLVVMGNDRLYGYDPDTGLEKWFFKGFTRETIAVPIEGDGKLFAAASMRGGRGDQQLDPEPFWKAALQFDKNGDQQISKDEISRYFTIPLRPELPVDHPGFGIPLPKDNPARLNRQIQFFDWRDQNRDGLWTKQEFTSDMKIGSGRPLMAAILPGGNGDITSSKLVWELRRGIPEIPSPVYHKNRIYMVRDGGLLTCVDATDGKVIYRERMDAPGQYAASPIIADNHLYCISQQGVVSVIQLGDTLEIKAQSKLPEKCNATPAISNNTIYIRTQNTIRAFRNSDS